MNIKSPFGLQNGHLVHISQVENGLACNCLCPYCNKQLIAKKGNIKEHHFAHDDGKECGSAFEAALQIIGKNILEKHGKIVLPPVYYRNSGKLVYPHTEVLFQKIDLERLPNNQYPYIVVHINDKPLLVQIGIVPSISRFTSHIIGDLGFPAININLATLFNSAYHIGLGNEIFEKRLIEDVSIKNWLSNSKTDAIRIEIERIGTSKPRVDTQLDFHPIIVEDCPLEKRIWKSGYKEGKSYADIFDDCWNCPFGKVIRAKKYFNNEETENGKILSVLCSGNRLNDIDKIIARFRNSMTNPPNKH